MTRLDPTIVSTPSPHPRVMRSEIVRLFPEYADHAERFYLNAVDALGYPVPGAQALKALYHDLMKEQPQ